MLLAITDLMPRLIFSLLWLWSKNTAPEHRKLEPIQDLNFRFDIETKTCRSLATNQKFILFIFKFFHTSNTWTGDRATKACTSSHFQGHFLRIENHWIFLKIIFFWKYLSWKNNFYNKYLLKYLISKVLYFLKRCVQRAIFDRCNSQNCTSAF